jgi:hypothetical protein
VSVETQAVGTRFVAAHIQADIRVVRLAFLPGEVVRVRAPGFLVAVVQVTTNVRGSIYNVEWWQDSERKSLWCEEHELEEAGQ